MRIKSLQALWPRGRRAVGYPLLLSAFIYCAAVVAVPAAYAASSDAPAPGGAGQATAQGTAQALCDVLLQVMKQGSALDFAGRVKVLDPVLRRLYDMPLVTRLVVGPPWRGMSADDQQQIVAAFSDYSVAVYAGRFKSYDGEKFVVDPSTATASSGDTIAHTKLMPHNSEPVELDYLMRQESGSWKIVDVLLSGTISEMAERRSEYASSVRDGGAAALVKLLRDKTAQLAAQR